MVTFFQHYGDPGKPRLSFKIVYLCVLIHTRPLVTHMKPI